MKRVFFLTAVICLWGFHAYAQAGISIAQASGDGQVKYVRANNKSLMTQLMKTEFDIRQLKIKLMDMNKKRHNQYNTVLTELNCETLLEVKKIIDRLINNHCDIVKNKKAVYERVVSTLDKSVLLEKKMATEIIEGDASVLVSRKAQAKEDYSVELDSKVSIAKQIPSNMSPLDLKVATSLQLNGTTYQNQNILHNENQTATQSMAADKFLVNGKVFPVTDTNTTWRCRDIERGENESDIAGLSFSLVCQAGILRVKSKSHAQSFINGLISCKQKNHTTNDVWKEVQPDKSVIFYACIENLAAPLYQMDWNPTNCDTVGKGYGESWYAVSHFTEQPCTVGPNSNSFSNGIKSQCSNPASVKRNIEVAWSCNSYGHIVPAENLNALSGSSGSTFQMGMATVGREKLWQIYYRLGDYAEPNVSCKLFELVFRNMFNVPSGTPSLSCSSPLVEAYDIFPTDQAQRNDPSVGQQYQQGVKCEGQSPNRSCYINCRTSCDRIDDFGKSNLIAEGHNPQWLAPGTAIQNNYPDMVIDDETQLAATFFNGLPLTTIRRTDVTIP